MFFLSTVLKRTSLQSYCLFFSPFSAAAAGDFCLAAVRAIGWCLLLFLL